MPVVTLIREKDKKTPLMMVTTEAEKSRVLDVLKAGVNGYVIKPFTADVLLDRAKKLITAKTAA